MKKYKLEFDEREIDVIIQMFHFGRLEISRQLKRVGPMDFDLKEYYSNYRFSSNIISEKLNKIRGYPLKR